MLNETAGAKFNRQLSILKSLDLLSTGDTDTHIAFPAPKISGGGGNLSSLFPGFPCSQRFSAYKIWVAPSHSFHELNFLCSFWNLSSCLEFHPQDSETLKQAVTVFLVFFPPLKRAREYFPFCRFTQSLSQPCRATAPWCHKCNRKQDTNKQTWLDANKTLFTKQVAVGFGPERCALLTPAQKHHPWETLFSPQLHCSPIYVLSALNHFHQPKYLSRAADPDSYNLLDTAEHFLLDVLKEPQLYVKLSSSISSTIRNLTQEF